MSAQESVRQVVIIGSGPAGFTAAIYAARATLEPLVLGGVYWGGQLVLTSDVENYPGYPDGVLGPDMMAELRTQAERFGAEVRTIDVTRVDFRERPFVLETDEGTVRANSVIIATGASAKRMEAAGEEAMFGRGVSTCATCDGWFYRDKPIAVVGGGDSALEEALFLTRFASHITVIHRRDALRASKVLQQRAFANPKIDFRWNTVVEKVLGDERVEGLQLRDTVTGAESELPLAGVFVAVGHQPNTALFAGQIDLDAAGYIARQDGETTATNIPGVFAAGDVRDHRYRQAITAAGDGCKAAMDAERWLEAQGVAEPNLMGEIYDMPVVSS
ncbi:MAG: thioredoxin-disulfide reductase [Thermomicrobiales bacterium]|nr:thioredoxin-disulfide reductase [Thermomicrobiales bacterium]